jgi:isocitrate/isopropylmalate dehydrogenase
MKTVVALPGEGIGVEVVDATCELMSAAGMPVKILTPLQVEAPGGASPGARVPDDTRRACREADGVLFGAAGPATSAVVGWLRWRWTRSGSAFEALRACLALADPEGIDFVVIRRIPRASIWPQGD